jgi:hypothetical protein
MDKSFKEKEEAILNGRLMPPVKSLKLASDKFFKVVDGCKFEVNCPEDGAVALAEKLAKDFWQVSARVSAGAAKGLPDNDEGYSIRIAASKTVLSAKTLRGLRYAFFTLRQLAESERGVATSRASFILPCVAIDDAPATAWRGMHVCFFPTPETTYVEIERQIRLAAYFKFNYVVIEPWGSLRYPSHPEFSWPGHSVSAGEFRNLVRIAKSLGLTPIPQLNIFGHAPAARGSNHKHTLLDFHPEFAPLFEPDGWCWCLSNPATRAFLTDLVNDLFDIFENPPFFHLGCDEAGDGTCALCRRADYPTLLKNHLLYFNDILKKRGARPMVWHDMFVERGDKRWAGYVACGTPGTISILDKLPKDFVICDWRYNSSAEERNGAEPSFATLRHFIDKGFDTLGCPWFDTCNTLAFGKAIQKYGAMGMLETTWHIKRSYWMHAEFAVASRAAWNPLSADAKGQGFNGGASFAAYVRDVNHDMGVDTYEDFGTAPYQLDVQPI